MKKIIKYFLIALVGLVFVFILTNPSPKTFEKSLAVITKTPNIFFKSPKTAPFVTYGRQNNYLILSIYEININMYYFEDGKETFLKSEHYKVLGIFENFYILKKTQKSAK